MTARRFFGITLAIDGAAVVLVVALASWLGEGPALMGACLGGLLGSGNLVALLVLGRKTMTAIGPRWPYLAGIAVKFFALIALVYLAVRFVEMDTAWFVAGISGSVVALVAASLFLAASPTGLET